MNKRKYKPFLDLTSSQKRRRLQTVRSEIEETGSSSQNVNDSDSSTEDVFQNQRDESQVLTLNEFQNEIRHDASSDSNDSEMVNYDGEEEVLNEEVTEEEEALVDHPLNLEENINREENLDQGGENIIHLINADDARKTSLKNAFLAANLKHTQCNIMLETLREFPFNLNFLPKVAGTILRTPTNVASAYIQQIAGGEYLHIGFKETLLKKLTKIPLNLIRENCN